MSDRYITITRRTLSSSGVEVLTTEDLSYDKISECEFSQSGLHYVIHFEDGSQVAYANVETIVIDAPEVVPDLTNVELLDLAIDAVTESPSKVQAVRRLRELIAQTERPWSVGNPLRAAVDLIDGVNPSYKLHWK